MASSLASESKLGKALHFLKGIVSTRPAHPYLFIICGSGLSRLSDLVEPSTKQIVPYDSIPGFPEATVPGHAGELVFGQIEGVECMIMRGRFHTYEGHAVEDCVMPVRLAHFLGCKMVFVTNASGGINPKFKIGDIAILTDHIGLPTLTGAKNPLVGPNDPSIGPRFPAMSNAYDIYLHNLVVKSAEELGITEFLQTKCTYAFVSGPSYETPAECLMLRSFGCDNVGMSTVPEIMTAKHCGMRILGLSLITNKVVLPGDSNPVHASHEEVLQTTEKRSSVLQSLVAKVISKIKVEEVEQDLASHTLHFSHVPSTATALTTPIPKHLLELESRLQALNLSSITPLQAIKVLDELKSLVQ